MTLILASAGPARSAAAAAAGKRRRRMSVAEADREPLFDRLQLGLELLLAVPETLAALRERGLRARLRLRRVDRAELLLFQEDVRGARLQRLVSAEGGELGVAERVERGRRAPGGRVVRVEAGPALGLGGLHGLVVLAGARVLELQLGEVAAEVDEGRVGGLPEGRLGVGRVDRLRRRRQGGGAEDEGRKSGEEEVAGAGFHAVLLSSRPRTRKTRPDGLTEAPATTIAA